MGGDPLVKEGFELGVKRDVAVVVELAQRNAQPERGADLNDGVSGETQELADPDAGAGQDLDAQSCEGVGLGSGRSRIWARLFWLWFVPGLILAIGVAAEIHPLLMGVVLALSAQAVNTRRNLRRVEQVNKALLSGTPHS